MANYTSVHTGAVVDASVTKVSASGVTQADLTKLNAVTSTAAELNILDGVTATYTEINVLDGITASTVELNILDGVTANATELNYLDGADPSINTLVLPDNTTISIFGASLIDDADAASARTTLNVDVAGTDNSTDVTLVTTSYDYLSIAGQAITLGQIDISDDTNLVAGTNITLSGDTLNVDDAFLINSGDDTTSGVITAGGFIGDVRGATKFLARADVALAKGDAVYISGVISSTPTVGLADANDASKMPSFGLAATSAAINDNVEIITFGTISGIDTSAFTVGDILYISTAGTTGNTLTATPPSGESSLIQNIGIVQRVNPSVGSIKVGGAGRTNATPNLNDGNIFIGNGSNQVTTASLNTKIETYLDGGTSSPNFASVSIGGTAVTATATELNILDGADADLNTLSLPASTTISTFGASLVDDLDASAARTTLGVDPAGTDNSTDVTLAGSLDYLTIAGQVITRNAIDLAADVSGILPLANGGTGASTASGARTNLNVDVAGTDNSTDVTLVTTSHDYLSIAGQAITLGTIDISDDTNLVGGTGITLTGDTLSTTDSEIVHDSLSGFVANEHIDHSTVSITAGTGLSGGGDLTLTRTLSTNDSQIVHDNLSGFVANEHIDHSGVTITAGSGLTGGGDITATRTLNVGAGTHITVNADDVAVNTSTLFSAPAFTGTATGVNLTLSGDLTVNGTTTTLNTTNVAVTDNLIELNQGTTSNANDSGILIERGTTGDNAIIMWDESADKFTVGTTTATASATGDIVVSTGTLVASTFEGNVTGNVTGNADTATALATGRTISLTGDVTGTSGSFDGTGNVSIAATIAANSVALGTDTTGNYMSDLTEGTGIDISHTPAEGSNATITLDLTEVGFGGGANRLITDDGDGTVSTDANLTFNGTALVSPQFVSGISGSSGTYGVQLLPNTTGQSQFYIDNHDNRLRFGTGALSGSDLFQITSGGNAILNATKALYLDGGSNTFIDEPSGDQLRLVAGGTEVLKGYSGGAIDMYGGSINRSINIGANRTADASSFIDLVGDTTYTDYGARLIRNSGANAITDLTHRGTGALRLRCQDAGAVLFMISDAEKMRVASSGNVGIGETSPEAKLHIKNASAGTFTASNSQLLIENNTTVRLSMVTPTNNASKIEFGDVDDQDAGILEYNNSDNSMRFTTNTSEAMRINSSGNVGIGTTSPQGHLDINTENAEATKVYINGEAGQDKLLLIRHLENSELSTTNALGFIGSVVDNVLTLGHYNSSGSEVQVMHITEGGNVGIGTNSPSAKLEVNGDLEISPAEPTITLNRGNGSYSWRIVNGAGTGSYPLSTFNIANNAGTPVITALDSGNVGIGTTSPQQKLHIFQTEGGVGAKHATIRLGGYSTVGAEIAAYRHTGNSNDQGLIFSTYHNTNGTTDTMTLDSDGNVGIGTTSPLEKLHIYETGLSAYKTYTSAGAGVLITSYQSQGSPYTKTTDIVANSDGTVPSEMRLFTKASGASSASERLRIDSSGNVGIGTSSPTEKLQVDGRINIENSGALALAPSASTTLYSASGELYVHDAADNVTLLSPHNFSLIPGGASEDRAWSYFSQKPIRDEEGNVTHTQKVNVDMMKLARLVEQLTGEKLVYTEEDENG